jgi:hypothetical protein
MATAMANVYTWFAGYDMTGQTNNTSLTVESDELDDTPYGATARSRIAGLESVESSIEGFWNSAESAAVDPEVFNELGGAVQVVTQSPTGAEGGVAYLWQARKFTYTVGTDVGEVLPFKLDARNAKSNGSAGAVRGQVATAKGTVNTTGALGSALELGAVSAGQYLYGSFHVFGSGTTITVVLESDEDDTFASATTRATIGPLTAAGGAWATRTAGAITDTWFRYRVTAVTGTFTVAGAIGIK